MATGDFEKLEQAVRRAMTRIDALELERNALQEENTSLRGELAQLRQGLSGIASEKGSSAPTTAGRARSSANPKRLNDLKTRLQVVLGRVDRLIELYKTAELKTKA